MTDDTNNHNNNDNINGTFLIFCEGSGRRHGYNDIIVFQTSFIDALQFR